ncbi:MAG: hypothetical protein HZB46_16030 [Solirubrobacterales bacterium]|nr:hypothetical protein [Solirubrobacterales bacterium]
MTQPKKPRSTSTRAKAAKAPARSAAKATARAGAKPTRKAATPRTAPKAAPKAAPKSAPKAAAKPSDDGRLTALLEKLTSSLTLPTERLQEAIDDAVERGRMTRKDGEDLLSSLISAGRSQTEALIADVEQLLGRGRVRATRSSDRVLKEVDKARRRAGIPGFPIIGYDDLSAKQVTSRLGDLTPAQLRKVRDHEKRRAGRKSVLDAIEKKLA